MPTLLDLCCCDGGSGVGYARAGFTVTGVDIVSRPNYPFKMIVADAIEYCYEHGHKYDAIHASWPCQWGCSLTAGTNEAMGWGAKHVDLVPPGRRAMEHAGRPYVIEQPNGRAKIRKDITLCGEMFGLAVLRHRNFELGRWSTAQPGHKPHRGYVRGWRHGVYRDGPYVAAYGSGGGKATVQEMQQAMGIDWTDDAEALREAIPPSYTEWIGRALLIRLSQLTNAA